MDSGAGPDPDVAPLEITPELLADLQAGLLDDATAARVRSQARADPEAAHILAALDTVRRELALLGADEHSAPDVPAAVTARVGAALRTQPAGGHVQSRPRLSRGQSVGLVVGICAAAASIVLGGVMLARDPGPAFPRGPAAAQITVSGSADPAVPLSDAELRALLAEPPGLGPLADPTRRASCLSGLGYSPTLSVLGGRPLEIAGRPGVLLLLPGEASEQLNAVVVEPNCNAAHTGLLAETTLTRR